MFEEAIEYTSCRWNALNENKAATSRQQERKRENQSAATKKQARKMKYV